MNVKVWIEEDKVVVCIANGTDRAWLTPTEVFDLAATLMEHAKLAKRAKELKKGRP